MTSESMLHFDVLLIDDDADDRVVVTRLLERSALFECDVTAVATSEEGLAACRSSTGCVVLDYRLPDSEGWSVLEQMRAAQPHVPIVLLTGIGDERIASEGMKLGGDEYVTKDGLTSEVLANAIWTARERAAVRRALHDRTRELEQLSTVLRESNANLLAAMRDQQRTADEKIRSLLALVEDTERARLRLLIDGRRDGSMESDADHVSVFDVESCTLGLASIRAAAQRIEALGSGDEAEAASEILREVGRLERHLGTLSGEATTPADGDTLGNGDMKV